MENLLFLSPLVGGGVQGVPDELVPGLFRLRWFKGDESNSVIVTRGLPVGPVVVTVVGWAAPGLNQCYCVENMKFSTHLSLPFPPFETFDQIELDFGIFDPALLSLLSVFSSRDLLSAYIIS